MSEVSSVTQMQNAQRAIYYKFDEFKTEQLQKHGLVNVTIRPKISAAVVARVSQLSNNNIYYKGFESIFISKNDTYNSLSRDINYAIRQRALEIADQIAGSGNLASEYDVTVELDERTEKLLQRAYNEFMIRNELRRIYRNEIIPVLNIIDDIRIEGDSYSSGNVRQRLSETIDELAQQLDNVDDAVKQFRERANKELINHMIDVIKWMSSKANEFAKEKKQLYDEFAKEKKQLYDELKALKEKIATIVAKDEDDEEDDDDDE